MNNDRSLVTENRQEGTLHRARLAGTQIQDLFQYRGVSLAEKEDFFYFEDAVLQQVLCGDSLPASRQDAYRAAVLAAVRAGDLLRTGTNERLYRAVHAERLRFFGAGWAQRLWQPSAAPAHTIAGIDQTALIQGEAARCASLVCSLTDPAYIPDFVLDARQAVAAGKTVWCLCSAVPDGILPDRQDVCRLLGELAQSVRLLAVPDCCGCMDPAHVSCPPALQADIQGQRAFLLGYGEEALAQAHGLALSAGIRVTPESFYCRAVTNLFSRTLACAVWIPAGFSIDPYVPVSARTVLTYYHLAALEKRFASSVYHRTAAELYALAPGLFLNIYDDHFPAEYNPLFTWDGRTDFSAARADYLDHQLNRNPAVRYFSAYLDEDSARAVPLCWNAKEPADAVLIHGVCASPESCVSVVMGSGKPFSPREYWFDATGSGESIISNFSFFMTSRLQIAYNALRADRAPEQLRESIGHIDYRLLQAEGQPRRESFPLYGKACLGRQRGGGYRAFSFVLGAGAIRMGSQHFSWQAQQVNAQGTGQELLLYTPMYSCGRQDPPGECRIPVGTGRLNAVFIGDRLQCVRQGDVLLSCVGTVLSFSGAQAARLRSILGEPDAQGYFSRLPETEIRLAPPEGFTPEQWAEMEWVYGGGLSLIRNGRCMTKGNHNAWCRKEGWMSPLSRQTQESDVHSLVRHPRTAVGITAQGGLFALVFSGRTAVSAGANYVEMCRMANALIPDIRWMINWDGGASSVLGWVKGRFFTELSYSAPSDMSCTGMARPINSMLVIHLGENE